MIATTSVKARPATDWGGTIAAGARSFAPSPARPAAVEAFRGSLGRETFLVFGFVFGFDAPLAGDFLPTTLPEGFALRVLRTGARTSAVLELVSSVIRTQT